MIVYWPGEPTCMHNMLDGKERKYMSQLGFEPGSPDY